MRLKVKDMRISTGSPLIAVLNHNDASLFDIHALDRIKIARGRRLGTVVVDISTGSKGLRKGQIGLFKEVMESLKLKEGQIVDISLARKPLSIEHIRKKLNGGNFTRQEIDQIVWDVVHNKLSEIELTYFVAACYTNALSMEETVMLTKAMADHGDILDMGVQPVMDKHCIGGIPGNRTTPIVVSIISAAGFMIPKTSSRSITSPAGTADTMEVLAPVCHTMQKIKRILAKTKGCVIWGGSLKLAPADEKIIKVERPMGIDAESQLLASVMAKKHSVRSTHILIDIPVGVEAKVSDKGAALALQKKFEYVGKKLGMKLKVIITDGSQPVGNGIGPLLEARDILYILKRHPDRPLDLEEKCLEMASIMLSMAGVADAKKKAYEILDSGFAYDQMKKIIQFQGGDKNIDPDKMKPGPKEFTIVSGMSKKIAAISCESITRIARVAGAPEAKEAGIYLHKHVGDTVRKGEPLCTVYSKTDEKLSFAREVAARHSPFMLD